jgi:hypothetical protein
MSELEKDEDKDKDDEEEEDSGADLGKRLVDTLGEPYRGVVEELEEDGFHFVGVELEPDEIVLKFEAGEIECTLYKLLLDKIYDVSLSVMRCEVGGWPVACTRLKVSMPRQPATTASNK